ncbi:uncharacterized protein N7511_003856 [Penicillium nucicola]|uniref:uncharacterized protein n=1 Tax=Penicillium nucicola TaxID=1850975 RepID=UPI002545767C|nr:uncharacterized protein N7511_003856 [Penicillium nucicola]KAJ5766240.1 hypothetical protein N7511_003856 [Penicillium nucicola]
MVKQYAVPLDPEIYAADPGYTSLFDPYIHKQTEIADHASVQLHIDLNGVDGVGSKFGNLNAHAGNFTSLCAPNCLPERFALVAYTVEYAFLHDDETDNAADHDALLLENKMLHQALTQSGMTSVSTRVSEKAQRKSEVQAKIAAEYLRLDPVFGEWFISRWETFTKSVEDVRSTEFASLDEYLAFRIVDAAADWTLYNFRWGSGITLTEEEEKIADPMSYMAYAELCLVNDLFSWEKEYASHLKSGGDVPLVNAVHIVAVNQGLTHSAAKAVIMAEIRAHEERFCHLKEQYKSTCNPSRSVLDWLTLLEHSMAGNWVWSLRVPRYWKTERNPYKDHLETFGTHRVRVLAPPEQFFDPKTDTNTVTTIRSVDSKKQTLEDDALMKFASNGYSMTEGRDLHWSYHTHIPTPSQYIEMVDGKTGGLFRLISRLMKSEATINRDLDLGQLTTLLGRYFQIRDDYQNLKSAEYTTQKGFCDDLDEGKLSFPIILSMQMPGFSNTALSSIFRSCQHGQTLAPQMKQYILEEIAARGAFSQTKTVLKRLHLELLRLLMETEKEAGDRENWTLRLLIMKLEINDEEKSEKKVISDSETAWKNNQQLGWAGTQANGRPIDKACFLRALEAS